VICVIDNYDSFTYNLVQVFECLGHPVSVFRNDQITLEQIEEHKPSFLVLSPGPGTPAEAGISVDAVRHFGPRIPILGVCLGHQAIAAAFGGNVFRADRIMHGKTSSVLHDGKRLFHAIASPTAATRYHSLIVNSGSVPASLEISAWTAEGEIMGLRHREYPLEGVQFHPESILTDCGHQMIKNFIDHHSH
jgi:anthranilate synthase/aminodeoxychorismate synthase-like glutamine amidotransferase